MQGLAEAVWQMTMQPHQEGIDAAGQGQFPERLGEPDCVYYMRTGLCGFGQTCRFNHPPNRKMVRNFTPFYFSFLYSNVFWEIVSTGWNSCFLLFVLEFQDDEHSKCAGHLQRNLV